MSLNQKTSRRRYAAFTLVELLVSVAIIGLMLTIIAPAVQLAREAARRAACQNNLRQIGVSLCNYEGVNRNYSIGARHSVPGTFGLSWWVSILPYLEECELFDRIDAKSANCGLVLVNPRNARLVNNVVLSSMICPTSTVPPLREVGICQIMMPSYVGISGASAEDGFSEMRVNRCCTPRNDGEISAGGVLIANASVKASDIIDGTSNTLVIAEASDFAYYDDGTPLRIDGGFPLGWITGTPVPGTPPHYDSPTAVWNLTTIRYSLNERRFNLPGIHYDRGANNPLISPHPGGVQGLFVDGSVRFLNENIGVFVLKSLATRDDGQAHSELD